ncbi:MAG TPA: ABC transporter substrate-binding protein [Chloroflexota bacterium]|nr:ABC transporter substrate-binding protein [Chloroflexota bacterium]
MSIWLARRARFVVASIALALVAGCTPQAAQRPGAESSGKLGGSVDVLATWGGDEQDSFLAMVKPFEDQTGVHVQYESTRDLNAVLTTRVQGGNPPDVAGLPGPGQMAELARGGHLVDLAGVLDMSAMRDQYSDEWLRLGQVNGKQVGIFIKAAAKGLIWYDPKSFARAGYQKPASWDELMALSRRIADSGVTPWCIGLEGGASSGWPGTDWLEDIVLRQAGPDVYDQWYQGRLAWSSPEIKRAWQSWGQIVADPRMVFGGRQGMLATNFGDAGTPMFGDPPRCYLHHQASFITSFFLQANPGLNPVDDFDFFPFPDIDSQYAGAVEAAGDLFGMFKDTPQARALVKYLSTPQAQAIWVKRGGAISPNRQVPLTDYPDPLSTRSAQLLTGARTVRFDASDLMPDAMNTAFWKAILDYVNNPDSLDSILSTLDSVRTSAYAT